MEITCIFCVIVLICISVAPTIDPTQGTPVSLKRGADYKLKCAAKGNPVPDVVWRRNGVVDPRQQVGKLKQTVSLQQV